MVWYKNISGKAVTLPRGMGVIQPGGTVDVSRSVLKRLEEYGNGLSPSVWQVVAKPEPAPVVEPTVVEAPKPKKKKWGTKR